MLPMNAAIYRYIPASIRLFVVGCDRDSDGIWVWGNERFYDPSSGTHTVHVDTVAELRSNLRRVEILDPSDPLCELV